MQKRDGFTVWLTGQSSPMKRKLAEQLTWNLRDRGYERIEKISADAIRQALGWRTDGIFVNRDADDLQLAYICNLLSHNGIVAVADSNSPHREIREQARKMIGRFFEVYVDGPPDPGAADAAYEASGNPEMICKNATAEPETAVDNVMAALERLKFIPALSAYTAEEEETVRKRLERLGYL